VEVSLVGAEVVHPDAHEVGREDERDLRQGQTRKGF
jgi:hypothetical protein